MRYRAGDVTHDICIVTVGIHYRLDRRDIRRVDVARGSISILPRVDGMKYGGVLAIVVIKSQELDRKLSEGVFREVLKSFLSQCGDSQATLDVEPRACAKFLLELVPVLVHDVMNLLVILIFNLRPSQNSQIGQQLVSLPEVLKHVVQNRIHVIALLDGQSLSSGNGHVSRYHHLILVNFVTNKEDDVAKPLLKGHDKIVDIAWVIKRSLPETDSHGAVATSSKWFKIEMVHDG